MAPNASEDEKRERRPHVGHDPALISGASADGAGKSTTAASPIPFTFREWQSSIEATSNLFAAALKDGLESWPRLFGQRPAGFKWIPAGLC